MAKLSRLKGNSVRAQSSESNQTTFYDSVSENVNQYVNTEQVDLTIGKQLNAFESTTRETANIATNENLSTSTKSAALAVNAADMGLQAFQTIVGAVDQLSQAAVLPILKAIGIAGIASLPVTKQMDPVVGIDVHMVTIPPSPAPVPIPHPYIGMLLRPKDFVSAATAAVLPPPPPPPAPVEGASEDATQQAATMNKAMNIGHTAASMAIGMMGATVVFGVMPRAVAGTPSKNIPHFPLGAGWYPATAATIKKNKGHAFMGSLVSLADNDPISGGPAHLHLDCCDVGIPSPHTVRKSKNTDGDKSPFPAKLFLPTGLITPIPPSKAILTNPIPAPFNPMALLQKAVKGAFNRLGRYLKKKKKDVSNKLHDKINNKVKNKKLSGALHKAICTVTGHPVDVASGMFFTDEEDFNLPGPIPLSWERTWYSKSDYKGPLGKGWHHNYDIAMVVDNKFVSLRMADGRSIAFYLPQPKAPSFNKAEQLECRVTEAGEYYIWNIKEDVYYHFTTDLYNGVQLLKSIVNANSFSIQFKYNKQGQLINIIDSAHRQLQVNNDKEGRIVEILAPHPDHNTKFAIAKYTYNNDGNMIEQTNAVGDSMYFEYDNDLMIKEVWRNGLTWNFRYDGDTIGSRCIHTWGDGNIYNHKLKFYDGLTEVENSLGHITKYYHKGGLVTRKVDANGSEHYWQYDEDNQLLSETDPLGNSYLYDYDNFGNQIQMIDPVGATLQTEYTNPQQPHLPEQAKDANGGVWAWQYDEQGNTIARTNPLGAQTKIQYQDGLLQDITDALGNTTALNYNRQYNITEVLDDQGNITKYKYDILGRCVQITNPKGAIQQREFDLIGRVTKVKDFDGNNIELTYDGIDNLTQYKDSQQEVSYAYKGMWKLTKRSDQRGTTYYYYNTEEELTKILNEKGEAYTFTLDPVGNVVKEEGFDEAIKFYKRDAGSRVTKLTKPSGKTVNYKYDAVGRITELTHSTDETQSFDYNPAGQLISAINKDAAVSFARNALGFITTEEVNGESITHSYNNLGQRIGLQSSLGANLQFNYNNFGNLANLTAETEQAQWQADYKYDALGFEIERILPGKLQQTFNYDQIGRLTQQATLKQKQQKRRRKYTWGVNDRLLKTDDSQQGITRFTYTPTGHLEAADLPNGVKQIRKPDAVGNLYESHDLKNRTYGKGGRLEKKGSWHYQYDDDGFLVEKYKSSNGLFARKKEHWQYQWNAEGMLDTVIRPDKEAVTFTYDALGRRLSKTFKQTTTKWLWDGNVPLHEWKENQNGQLLSNSSVGDNGVVTWVFEANSFIPTAKLKGDKQYSIVADHLGTPTQVYNNEGETIWEGQLDTYGKLINTKGEHGTCPFRYQGQYEDAEICLYYNRFRYYSPDTGTYLSQDPIGLASGELNIYSYVNDSNSEVDVFGLNPIIVIGEGQRRVNKVARGLKRDGFEVRTITDDWAKEFKVYDNYKPELHEAQSIDYNRKWIKDRMAEGYDIYDIGGDGRNSPFYAAEHDEIRNAKYDQYYGYDAKNKKKYKMKLKCKS